MKKFLPIAMAAVMSMSAVAVSAVSANAVEPLNTPVQYAQVARASLATPKISKAESVYGGVKLTWNKVSGAAKYRVYYKGRKGWTRMVDTTSTSYIDKDVSSGRNYTYTVRCISADGKSFTSGYDSKGKSVKYIAAPEISKLENVNGGVKITWNKVNGASKYRIYHKNSSDWFRVSDTTSNSIVDKSVGMGTYTYTVRCISDDGKSFESGFNPKGLSIRYNQAPKILETNVVNGGIKVIWETENNTNYRLYCKTEGKGWTKVCDSKTGVVTHKNLQPNKTYTYTVRAISSDAKKYLSGYDPVGMSAKYVATPKISKAEYTYDGIKLAWNKVAGAEKYRVYYKDATGWNKLVDTKGTSYLDKGLVSRELSVKDSSVNGQYIYTVRCISSNGKVFQSGYDTKGVKSALYNNGCPEIYNIDTMHGGITLTWNSTADKNSKYRVYIKQSGSWKKIADTTDNQYTYKNVKAGQTYTFTVRCVSKDEKKFTSTYNPSGVAFKYKTTNKTRDAYIDYLLKHESEWLPELKVGDIALAGVQFTDLDFDGVPELIAQEAGDKEYYLNARVYTFKNGKLSLVGFDNSMTYIQNRLAYLYDKSAKRYVINSAELSTSNPDRYLDCENYTLSYDGNLISAHPYSSYHLALENWGLDYTYYVHGRTSKQVYNAANLSTLDNCVNAHMYSQFVYCSVDGYPKLWNSYSETQKKQHLTDSYNAFSYDKY